MKPTLRFGEDDGNEMVHANESGRRQRAPESSTVVPTERL